ncbi:MAG: DEAD/DEAH box helicase [Desulfobacteraceae bacterium]|nr:DEAD/DEAH box helicase [Desulfobacteraceae bacterium]MBC2754740.1 DEAD/DEAH box helicase [Desulfobacteraceae bacterium]
MASTLTVSVTPDRNLLPEWIEFKEKISEKTVGIQKKIYKTYTHNFRSWLFYLGFFEQNRELSPSVNYYIQFSGLFIQKLSRIPDLETLRHHVQVEIDEDALDDFVESAPMITGAEYIDADMLTNLWKELGQTFSTLIEKHEKSVASFFSALNPAVHLAGRVYFHLVENKNGELPFAFMATYSTGMGRNGKPNHLPLKNAINEYKGDDDKLLELLSTVYKSAEKSELIRDLIDTGELFHPLAWSSTEAYDFLKEIPFYEESGILCRIPDWWKQRSSGPSLDLSLGDAKPSFVGLDAIVDFNPRLLFGDTEVSEEEARQMLETSEGLAFIKNKWVPVNHEKLKQAIEAYDNAREMADAGFSLRDAMRLQLNPEKALHNYKGDVDIFVSSGEWLASVVEKLKNPNLVDDVAPGRGFNARLRDYQQKGLNWLYFLDSLNFGACLADDMGLGKTVQVLAFLSTLKKKNTHASLLIIPASLISNWISEIEKFFPDIRWMAAHPHYLSADNSLQSPHELNNQDLVMTTYALAQKYEWLTDYQWNYVILDEAQAIKNPATKQTRAVKKLNARNRIIMSGTPVENRISDLWSLFDFLNPGLLGNKTEFAQFAKQLKKNPKGYARLRKLVSPYVLRRLKTDKSVISDLPEKVEMKTYAGLSKKQVVLYKKAVADLEKFIKNTDGIQRKGVVLSSLMKFKQLCNHPDQFSGTGMFSENDSGKFQRLKEICETIYEKRERVLVFTQFKEMCEPLKDFLETIFNRNGLVFHGSVAVGKRKKIINQFQSDDYYPFMILSLKAGGVGLNLTKANHVVHFDRWWNPAVENQATDRVFRIGQKKNVVVHKFVTKGTIEEKIDQMLEDKKELSDKVISPSGESLITEMDNKDLINLFKLSL